MTRTVRPVPRTAWGWIGRITRPALHNKIKKYFAIGVGWVSVVEPGRKVIWVYTAPTEV
jgi:hypothetical protein